MASILVYIETEADTPAPASLQALGEGRRIATGLGAALHAVVLVGEQAVDSVAVQDSLVRILGKAGADRVVIVPARSGPGPAGWWLHGQALHGVCGRLAPRLVLMAATSAGNDIAPRLAARLGAAYVPEPSIEHGCHGEVVLSRPIYDALVRRFSLEDFERPAVVTLTPGSVTLAAGRDEADVLYIDQHADPAASMEYLGSEDDPAASLGRARVIVVAGGGVRTAEGYALIGELAAALGGELAATRTVCSRGLAPPERAIGVGSRHVSPDIYVVCAASGSSEHLAAISPDAAIIAINSDPHAPIFRAASYGIVGDFEHVVPALIAALGARAPTAATS